MNLDHIALNALGLDEEIGFFVDFLGLKLLQRWDEPRQAYVGFEEGPMIGLIEHPQFDGTASTKAHLAFQIAEADFDGWVRKVQAAGVEVVTGPKDTRRGRTILFRSPGKNIIEICYPPARETIAAQTSGYAMTDSVHPLLDAFGALPAEDRHAFAAAVLRRVLEEAPAEVSDEALIEAAEELFLELVAAEEQDGDS